MTATAVERREETQPLAPARMAVASEALSTLDDYARDIDVVLGKCDRAAEAAIHWMLEAGRLLDEVKNLLGHGQFEPWVRAHCRVSTRMARLYRQAWRRSQQLNRNQISDFKSLRDLLAYCAQHDPVVRTVRLGFESSEQYEAYLGALRRHPGALSEPVPLIIAALNAWPCQSTP